MKIEYALIPKEEIFEGEPAVLTNKSIQQTISQCFDVVNVNTVSINMPKTSYDVGYTVTYNEYSDDENSRKVYNLVFELDLDRKERTAEILSHLHTMFIGSDKLSKYYIILSFDEVSEYYCNKIYPHFQAFERLIRHLIFKMLTKAFGSLWVDKTFGKDCNGNDLKDLVKQRLSVLYPELKKNKDLREVKIIQEALYHLDIQQLEDFLFFESRTVNPEQLIDNDLSTDKLISLNKEQLVEILDNGRLKTTWDRFFSKDIKIDDPKIKISMIRGKRNEVAHSKPFFKNDYDESINLLNEFIPNINIAIDNITTMKYESITIRNVLFGFTNSLIKAMDFSAIIGKEIYPAVSKMAELGMTVYNSYQTQMKKLNEATIFATQKALEGISKSFDMSKMIGLDKTQIIMDSMKPKFSFDSPALKAIQASQFAFNALIPQFPLLDFMQSQQKIFETMIPRISPYPLADIIEKQHLQFSLLQSENPEERFSDEEILQDQDTNKKNITVEEESKEKTVEE